MLATGVTTPAMADPPCRVVQMVDDAPDGLGFLVDAPEPGLAGSEADGVEVVVKPVKIDELLLRLAAHVRNARVARLAPTD